MNGNTIDEMALILYHFNCKFWINIQMFDDETLK